MASEEESTDLARKYRQDPLISCFVPTCKNKLIMCPNKHFFPVPLRHKAEWCAAVNKPNVPKGSLYICEDHLDLKEDLQNYESWSSKNTQARLKPRVPEFKNLQQIQPSTSTESNEILDQALVLKENKAVMCMPEQQAKSVQATPKTVDCSVSANIFKRKKSVKKNTEFFIQTITESSEEQNPSGIGSTSEISGTESSTISRQVNEFIGRTFILNLIKNKPMAYLGIPKKYYWIIEYLKINCKLTSLHIIITLYKIKNNDSFARISDIFQISITTLWRIFLKTLKTLQIFFRQLVYWPTAIDIKKNLPLVFTTKPDYANVQTIIDCFEIEIEKPKCPIQQSLTWSEYKHCNTIKYIIGATPSGFINFVSEGYGGRISDMTLVEQSGFLETVPQKCTILADRGFKHLEAHLISKSVKVLRPPSVSKDVKMTKSEVMQSKIVASLRIHIERVIRRVRLFKILKPHAVVNNKLVSALDDVVIITCRLINLQAPLLKND